jgi:hypothetical protein
MLLAPRDAPGNTQQQHTHTADTDEKQFLEYFKEMPWLGLPFERRDLRDALASKFGVAGLCQCLCLCQCRSVSASVSVSVSVSAPVPVLCLCLPLCLEKTEEGVVF